MQQEKILDKIKKLIEKSKSTDSINEAETFMLKAQELLQQYNIDMSKAESHTSTKDKNSFGIDIEEVAIPYGEKFEIDLINAICRCNFTTCLRDRNESKMIVIGNYENVSMCIYLSNFFKNAILQLSLKSYSDEIDKKIQLLREMGVAGATLKNKAKEREYLHNYTLGCVEGIKKKMIEQKRKAMDGNGELTAIIHNNDNAVSLYVKSKYKVVHNRAKSQSAKGSGNGYDNGFRDGKNINSYKALD